MPALAIARQPLSSHYLLHFNSSIACLDNEARRSSLLSPLNLPPCLLQRQVACGVSCSLSSPSIRLGVEWLDKSDRIDSQLASSIMCQGLISCNSNVKILAVTSSLPSVRASKERLFDRFIANATGSCLDYDSTGFPVLGGGATVSANKPLVMLEKNLDKLVPQYDIYVQELLARAQSAHKIFNDEFVMKAFFEAEKAHKGQMRMSGDPYLQHCTETGMLLAGLGANSTIVAAALLHDAIDDSFMTYEYVVREFGTGVADLVKGVSKLSHLSKLARMNDIASRSVEANRLHTIFLAMLDARAVLIKLADRLHNMMTLEHLPMFKQQRFAKETLEIFVPLANRLGILSWKEKLENLCFKYLYPEQHEMLASKLLQSFDEAVIVSTMNKLDQALKDEGVPNHDLSGRFKSFYSIYRKMLKNNQHMDKIHDIHGLRLIVNNEQECYLALDIVHRLWPKVHGRFKDYIEHPKFNGYQSLHTVVLSEGELPLEIQIRSRQMHLQAEYGFAAHWRYKENNCHHSPFILQMVEWARWVISWQCEHMNLHHSSCIGDEEEDEDSIRPRSQNPLESHTCPYSYCCLSNSSGPLYIIMIENEKMLVHEFSTNTTVKDLLETVGRVNVQWAAYGFTVKEELRPRLNGVPITDPGQELRMGDVIELTPAIPDESLPECREEIQRMYDGDFSILSHDGGRN